MASDVDTTSAGRELEEPSTVSLLADAAVNGLRRGPAKTLGATGWIRTISTTDREAPTRYVGTGHGRGAVDVAHDGIWVANRATRSVSRVDPVTLEVTAIQKFRKMPIEIDAGPSAMWALGLNGWVWRIWPEGRGAEGIARLGRRPAALTVAAGLVWVLHRSGRLTALEPATGTIEVESRVPRFARDMVTVEGRLWISCGRGRRVVSVDPATAEVGAEVALPPRARCLAPGDGSVLVGCARSLPLQRGRLIKLDSASSGIAATFELPSQPRAIVARGSVAWVACGLDWTREGSIERVDLDSGETTTWYETDWAISDLALSGDTLLAAVSLSANAPSGPLAGDFPHMAGGGFGGGGDGGGGNC